MRILTIAIAFFFASCMNEAENNSPAYKRANTDTLPSMIKGDFTDDYDITYTINDSVWTQHPDTKYHIVKWNNKEQYLIAKNAQGNPSDGGLYTRIDYMSFDGMKPYLWGFCLTVYNAKNDSLAEVTAKADRVDPKKGCGGFPFSRMKRTN